MYECTPVALGRSSRPFNRSPLVNRWPGENPTVARVGGLAGRPYTIAAAASAGTVAADVAAAVAAAAAAGAAAAAAVVTTAARSTVPGLKCPSESGGYLS